MSQRLALRVGLTVAVIAIAAVVVSAIFAGNSRRTKSAAPAEGSPTALLVRRNLSDTQDLDATLGFADDRTVIARATGILTAIPAAGAIVRPGAQLYGLDGNPVVLLDGRRPASRDLVEGMSPGPDVLELERNLVKLGFDPDNLVRVDERFTAATRAAVEALQRKVGMEATGRLPVGSVVFLPGERRVTATFAHVGDAVASGTQVLASASTARVAIVALDMTERSLVSVGARVSVILPDSTSMRGTIASVGASATPNQAGDSGADALSSTVSVVVAIAERLSEPDGTPVTVRITTATHRRALSVPITALIAASGGQRSLEVVEADGSSRLVAVKTGIYAGGFVEVAGRGLHAGSRVLDAPPS